jgi:hypothetical protein
MDSKRRSENDELWSRIKTQIDGLKMTTDKAMKEANNHKCRALLQLCDSLEDEGYFDDRAVLIERLEYVDKIMTILSHDEAMKGFILS